MTKSAAIFTFANEDGKKFINLCLVVDGFLRQLALIGEV